MCMCVPLQICVCNMSMCMYNVNVYVVLCYVMLRYDMFTDVGAEVYDLSWSLVSLQ